MSSNKEKTNVIALYLHVLFDCRESRHIEERRLPQSNSSEGEKAYATYTVHISLVSPPVPRTGAEYIALSIRRVKAHG